MRNLFISRILKNFQALLLSPESGSLPILWAAYLKLLE